MISTNPFKWRRFPFALQVCTAVLLVSVVISAKSLSSQNPQSAKPLAYFIDQAEQAGLTMMNVFGGETTKKYIIETTGTGVAIFDFDNDGWPDIFIVNGTKLEGFPAGKAPTSHLYRNTHDGT